MYSTWFYASSDTLTPGYRLRNCFMKCLICIIKVRILFQTNRFSDNTVSYYRDDYKYISEPHHITEYLNLRTNFRWVDNKVIYRSTFDIFTFTKDLIRMIKRTKSLWLSSVVVRLMYNLVEFSILLESKLKAFIHERQTKTKNALRYRS